ncbi:MAG: hypothetical protein LKM31_10215 [Sphingobium sp.]|jgi:hypothetical protein|nr:hypothetical protein [Sphingobium sp.]
MGYGDNAKAVALYQMRFAEGAAWIPPRSICVIGIAQARAGDKLMAAKATFAKVTRRPARHAGAILGAVARSQACCLILPRNEPMC